ncbi:RCC1 and BTB domain-containing protein 2 [Folsomia candida]|uniref:RCC1 and BTB domain-containing protein 1 n=1 Tax=Folsomia candida TaxID=158441 RepID=A0A226DSP9_FOLCA|nr:RCC1 and BTB domain-containing protein 2 [Folsomia candida]OXA48048.1 RCC1 and BTB domain-containing protein 1 [Folsomia candida]
MEPSTSSRSVIPQENLKIWKIFRDVGPEGEEILKLAKLAHVANEKEALVVTTADETYSFLREDDGAHKITNIPELCRVQVKEFVTGSISLALTEDGRLLSWCNNFTSGAEMHPNIYEQLGRFVEVDEATDPNFIGRPGTVAVTQWEKVVQVALSELEQGRVVALTAYGDVIQWGGDTDSPGGRLIPNEEFDCEELICVVCGFDGVTFALSVDGEIFQWDLDVDSPTKSDICNTPVKKIAATKKSICALTAEGTVYICRTVSEGNPVWEVAPHFKNNVQDIATCWMENVAVVELKDGTHVAWDSTTGTSSSLKSGSSLGQHFADLCQKSHCTIGMSSPIRPVEKGTLGLEISNLWRTKDDTDVSFFLDGKTITAHKLILKSRSDYFAKMFSNEWKETMAGSVIEIKDTKHATFEAFLFYLYHDRVNFSEDEYESIFELMKLADSYGATNVARDCEKILIRGIDTENAFFLARNASSANALILEAQVVQ